MALLDEMLVNGAYRIWRMGDASSPVQDATANNGDLTVTGGTFDQPGPVAKAVTFNGSDDTASATLDLSDTPVATFETFVKWAAYADDDAVLVEFNGPYFSNDGSFIVVMNNSAEADTISIGWRGSETISRWTIPRSALTAGEFHHLVVVMNRTFDSIAVYVDGEPVTTTNRGTGAGGNFGNSTLYLASRGGASLFGAAGLAEVAVYKTALSSGRVAAHFAAALPEIARLDPVRSEDDDLGGDPTTDEIPETANALFGTVNDGTRIAGLTDYRCLYVKNTGSSPATDVRIWVETASSAGDVGEAIGEDTSNPAQTIASATTAPTGVSFSAPTDYAGGLTLGDLDVGESVPVWVRRIVSAGADGQTAAFTLGLDWDDVATDSTGTEIDVSYVVVESATIHVDADNVSASDAYTRLQATNAGTPFRTAQAAALVALPGDTIVIEPATSADATNVDPSIYARIHHLAIDGGPTDYLPYGDNTGNDPITVRSSVAIGGDVAKMRQPDGRTFKNWVFEDFQHGYDRGSGMDGNTAGTLQNTGEGMTFNRAVFTGGGYYIVSYTNALNFNGCFVFSPDGDSGGFMDGAGFHIIAVDTSDGTLRTGTATFTACHFEDVVGEDCLQVSHGPIAGGCKLRVEGCSFQGIAQSVEPGAPHTDCIQSLGGDEWEIIGNYFLNCATPFIASDDRNGRITIARNIMLGGFGIGITGQGTDEWIIAHNTILTDQGAGWSVAFGGRSPGVVQHVTMVNNVMQGFTLSDAILDEDSVFENNVMTTMPGAETPYGTNIEGLPELGTTARTADIARPVELANSPTDSPGLGDGQILTGGLATLCAEDFFGRAYASPPDCGALQSDPGTLVTPAPRAPYVINAFPVGTGVSRSTDVGTRFVPKPGETINPATITPETVIVNDSAGVTIPAGLTLADLDEDGGQDLTVDLKYTTSPDRDGRLDYLNLYTVTLTGGIEDTEGSAIPATSWEFKVIGRGVGVPAITAVSSGPLVGLRQPRTAQLLTAGGTGAQFEKPSPSAAFEQADPSVIR